MKKTIAIITFALLATVSVAAGAGSILTPAVPVTSSGSINVAVVSNTATSSPVSFSYNYIQTTNSTTTVKNAAGILHAITIDTPATSSVITVFDGTVASNTVIAKITLPATLLAQGPYTALFDVAFTTNLTIQQTGGTSTFTAAFQ